MQRFGQSAAADWQWQLDSDDASAFRIRSRDGQYDVRVEWTLTGLHNVSNAVAALVAARHVGVTPDIAAAALGQFASVKRRMELVGEERGIRVYDDFAHHPTAIATTLEGARARLLKEQPQGRILAVLEPRSNTMKLGVHKAELASSVDAADMAFWYQPDNIQWSLAEVAAASRQPGRSFTDHAALVSAVIAEARAGDRIIVMSNGGFGAMPKKLLAALQGSPA